MDGDKGTPTTMDDNIAISVRSVGKMYYLYDRPQDRLKQTFLWGRKKLYHLTNRLLDEIADKGSSDGY